MAASTRPGIGARATTTPRTCRSRSSTRSRWTTTAPFYNVYGGTQDNATQGGPSRTNNVHGIRNSDWFVTVFGDGFDPVIDPTNPNIIYSQWQYGGLVRYDRRSGERIDIKPQEDKNGPPLRWNWDSALILSPHSPTRLYYGSQILFRSDDRGDTVEGDQPGPDPQHRPQQAQGDGPGLER